MWSMGFMHDPLADGRSIRLLNVNGDFNREALGMALSRLRGIVARCIGTAYLAADRPDRTIQLAGNAAHTLILLSSQHDDGALCAAQVMPGGRHGNTKRTRVALEW